MRGASWERSSAAVVATSGDELLSSRARWRGFPSLSRTRVEDDRHTCVLERLGVWPPCPPLVLPLKSSS